MKLIDFFYNYNKKNASANRSGLHSVLHALLHSLHSSGTMRELHQHRAVHSDSLARLSKLDSQPVPLRAL